MANKKTLKRRMQRMKQANNIVKHKCELSPILSFADCPQVQAAPVVVNPFWMLRENVCNQPKEQNMGYAVANANVSAPVNLEAKRIDYLKCQLNEANEVKHDELKVQFGVTDMDSPHTANELVARIKDGKFVIDAKRGDQPLWGSLDNIRWRDPAVVEDTAGLCTAFSAMDSEYTKAERTIMVSPAADGLTALQAFEAWMPAPGTVAN